MLTKELIKTMLVVRFSGNSTKPINTVVSRIIVGLLCAVTFGRLLAESIKNARLPIGMPENIMISILIVIGFILGGFIVLAISSSNETNAKNNSFVRILKLLPVSNFTNWLVLVLPTLIILVMVWLFAVFVVQAVCQAMEISTLKLSVGLWVGLLCGYGCILSDIKNRGYIKAALFISLIAVIGVLFDMLLKNGPEGSGVLWIINMLTMSQLIGHYSFYKKCRKQNICYQAQNPKQLIPNRISYNNWFLVKIFRNIRTKSSFMIAFILAISASTIMIIRDVAISNEYQLMFLAALLTATFACDIRGVIRKFQPPEMVLLKGVRGILRYEAVSVLVCGYIIGTPLFFVLAIKSGNLMHLLGFYIAIQFFGSIIGLLASTIFVPTSKDVGSQFLSAAFAVTTLVFLPRAIGFSDIDYYYQKHYWIASACIALCIIYLIEKYRRRKYGYI